MGICEGRHGAVVGIGGAVGGMQADMGEGSGGCAGEDTQKREYCGHGAGGWLRLGWDALGGVWVVYPSLLLEHSPCCGCGCGGREVE